MIYGANGGNATDPKVDRVKADATGCDAAALAAPCFDIGTGSGTYLRGIGNRGMEWQHCHHLGRFNGACPALRGRSDGQLRELQLQLVITSLSVPPTQSTASGAGEVGQTFTFTANNSSGQAIGGSAAAR